MQSSDLFYAKPFFFSNIKKNRQTRFPMGGGSFATATPQPSFRKSLPGRHPFEIIFARFCFNI